MAKIELLVSAIAVLHEDRAVLQTFVEELSAVLDSHYSNWEIILVDNGSADGTEKSVKELLNRQRCVRYLRLTRPTDDETAIMAGLDAAIGDFVVTLNPEFDPPAELVKMVDICREGGDLVLGSNRNPGKPGALYGAMRGVFFSMSKRLIGVDLPPATTGFRVLSRQAVNALVKVRVRRRYFALVAADVGLATSLFPYDLISRSGKKPARSVSHGFRLGISVLVHNSGTLLRIASGLGLLGSFMSLSYNLYAVLIYIFKRNVPQGWTTLSFAISCLFAIAFLMLALMGEYLHRLIEESTDRPLYHVRDEQSSAIMLSDAMRPNVLDRAVEEERSVPQAAGEVRR